MTSESEAEAEQLLKEVHKSKVLKDAKLELANAQPALVNKEGHMASSESEAQPSVRPRRTIEEIRASRRAQFGSQTKISKHQAN
jgi:hypothetical protein